MRAHVSDRATRHTYDAVATDYAQLLPDMSAEAPLDRAVLAAFGEMTGGGLVADVGCGTGRVTSHLADRALQVVGLDLSPGMVEVARSARADLAFAVADAGALPLRSGALGGLLAWYSLIHLQPGLLPGVLAEFARVTRPGAPVLIGFQSGDGEQVDRTTAYGHQVPLTYYRHSLDEMSTAVAEAGFALHATVRREASLWFETTPQACLLALRR